MKTNWNCVISSQVGSAISPMVLLNYIMNPKRMLTKYCYYFIYFNRLMFALRSVTVDLWTENHFCCFIHSQCAQLLSRNSKFILRTHRHTGTHSNSKHANRKYSTSSAQFACFSAASFCVVMFSVRQMHNGWLCNGQTLSFDSSFKLLCIYITPLSFALFSFDERRSEKKRNKIEFQ